MFMENDRLLAVLPAAQIEQPDGSILFVSHPGASHGGIMIQPSVSTHVCLQCVRVLLAHCREAGFSGIRLKLVPRIYHRGLADQLDFALRFTGFGVEYAELATALALQQDEEPFLKRVMRSPAYRNYKKAMQSGLSVVEDAGIGDFWPVLENKLLQGHQAKPAHTLAEIKRLKTLYPEGIKLFAAYEEKVCVAGVIVFLLNERVINCFYIAHDDRYQQMRPLNFVFAYLMAWGRKNGYTYLDWGISTEERGSKLNAELLRFKEGFGGRGVLRESYFYDLTHNAFHDLEVTR